MRVCLLVVALLVCVVYSRELIVSISYNDRALITTLYQRSNPHHPLYGQWLNDNNAMRSLLNVDEESIAIITHTLNGHGCNNVKVTAHGDHIIAQCKNGYHLDTLLHTLRTRHANIIRGVHVQPSSTTSTLPTLRASRKRVSRQMANKLAAKLKRGKRQGYVGDPNSQRQAYGIPATQVATNPNNYQMVWGPGTYGYTPSDISQFYQKNQVNSSVSTITTVGFPGVPGGDNFGECTLDVSYSTGIGNQVPTQVSNTNTSQSTEEGNGFGYAFLAFSINLTQASSVPGVLSLSLGSLSAYSCSQLCVYAKGYGVSESDCSNYMQNQRQICMMDSVEQSTIISTEMAKLGLRGTTVTAAAGDGGSHFSFQFFPDDHIGRVLNKISCQYNFDTFPASSPYVLAVGGSQWNGGSPTAPIAWSSGGSGFAWSFPQPSYQAQEVAQYLASNQGRGNFPKTGSFNPQGRAYPDVVALADNIPMVEQGQDTMTGGTSASAPEWAGIISLLNDVRLNKGLRTLGFVNVRLYQAMRASNGTMLYDITQGNSRCALNGCCDDGFPAVNGWDAMTGYGSPQWSSLFQYMTN